MAAPKFTPAPWKIEGDLSALPEDIGVGICNRSHDGDDWNVASVHSSAANARLIAAAPDLYEALVDLLKGCACGSCGLCLRAGRALAKARGR